MFRFAQSVGRDFYRAWKFRGSFCFAFGTNQRVFGFAFDSFNWNSELAFACIAENFYWIWMGFGSSAGLFGRNESDLFGLFRADFGFDNSAQ